ncbi:hypothetical protein AAFC00_003913 [Neodothiora populina]|uniref:Aquaporin-like protein n=1 Tax=Neodothiora populina TaxID=2781224 RepID=A0ABR3PFT1_9PEZI
MDPEKDNTSIDPPPTPQTSQSSGDQTFQTTSAPQTSTETQTGAPDLRSPIQSPNGRGRPRASTTGAATSAREGAREGWAQDFASPRRSNTETMRSPRRRGTAATDASEVPTITVDRTQSSLRRRNTSRQSGSVLQPMASNASRASRASRRSNFTLAGPEDNMQLRTAHAPFVHPGYADLNPEYEQPANTKPVWSLAKPLPRVIRPGMVPTMSEVQQIRNQLPGENAANEGMNVDPDDLEKGKIQKTLDPSKLSAQLKDARAQREHNFLQNHTGTTRTRGSRPSRLQSTSQTGSRFSSRRLRRRSTWAPDDLPVGPMDEDVEQDDGTQTVDEGDASQARPPRPSAVGTRPGLTPIRERSREPSYTPDDPYNEQLFDDGGSLTTLGDDDMPGEGETEPIVENIIEEEVHNHHTSWSVIRTQYREFLGEILGVIVQLSLGFCSDLSVTCANAGNPNTTEWAWGFATMAAIYVAGGISGAHFNPAVTIVLYIYRGFPKSKMPSYFIAQFLGAFIAAYIAYGLYLASIHHYLETNDASGIINSFVTNQRYTFIDAATAFFNEFYGTLILVVVILALGDDSNAPPGAGMNAFIVGLTVTLTSIAFAYQTGAALNPSRDFGPRLALLSLGYGKELFTNAYWFYGPWCGAISGACVGAAVYDIMVFTGGESPINYPWTRTKRAAHKSKRKWLWKFHLTKKEPSEDVPIETISPQMQMQPPPEYQY